MLEHWCKAGGSLDFGTNQETSCFLWAPRPDGKGWIWPVVLLPQGGGKVEVVFQHLSRRPPFDEIAVRDGLRRRLNEIPGVELGENKLTRRPNFPLALLQGEGFERFTFALDWFLDQVGVQVGDPVTAAEDASEETFQSELIESCLLAQAEVGYDAQPFVRRVKDVGAVTAVKEILDRPYVSEALMALVDRGRPDLTIEALVCEPHYARLFTPE